MMFQNNTEATREKPGHDHEKSISIICQNKQKLELIKFDVDQCNSFTKLCIRATSKILVRQTLAVIENIVRVPKALYLIQFGNIFSPVSISETFINQSHYLLTNP